MTRDEYERLSLGDAVLIRTKTGWTSGICADKLRQGSSFTILVKTKKSYRYYDGSSIRRKGRRER